MGNCVSGGRAVQSPAPPVHLSKCPWALNTKLFLMVRPAPCTLARCSLCDCVCGKWVNKRQTVKRCINAAIYHFQYTKSSVYLFLYYCTTSFLVLSFVSSQSSVHRQLQTKVFSSFQRQKREKILIYLKTISKQGCSDQAGHIQAFKKKNNSRYLGLGSV